MKQLKSFRLGEEAIAKIEQQENQSAFIEKAILGYTPSEKYIIEQLEQILKSTEPGDVIELETTTKTPITAEEVAHLERKHALNAAEHVCYFHGNENKCAHWIWDGIEARYANSLTGEIQEVFE